MGESRDLSPGLAEEFLAILRKEYAERLICPLPLDEDGIPALQAQGEKTL